MPTMRPRPRILPLPVPARAARPLATFGVLTTLALGLAACANDTPLTLPVPPDTSNVAEVPADSYPTIGTTPRTGRAPMTDAQRARLQRDLEQVSRDREAKIRSAVDSGN
ncbi:MULTISPECIES: hypothetical protein [unclassified Xanthobacter]|uniref:hypothetical protein n=1 Tax=unclassified Xanthobacter TaxID=2623496 RepID=UPI001EE0D1F4|nr:MULTISPECIES: hypothetical protein [unclassified Xanthobacter]